MSETVAKPKKQKVVIQKNYPLRNRLMGIFSLPLLLMASMIVMIPFVALGKFNFAMGLILTVVAEVLVILLALNFVDEFKNWRTKLRLQNFKWKTVGFGFGLGLCAYVILQLLAIGFGALGLEVGSSETSTSLGGLNGAERVILLYIAAPFLIPFLEEVFFRGYTLGFIQDSFPNSKKKGIVWGIIISSIAFSLAHFQGFSTFGDFFLLAWIGVIAVTNGFLVVKFKSVYPGFALHLGYNGLTVLATIFLS